ncbi:GtrA family protein [Pseudomonas sp. Fl4BN1]|uniref:GtrA family protein n=1 Tax=Pseudomonas sp. Fl4BN1 TaxID=2697651 RepID=UPI0013765C4F|nr:GtrA family protein [Pseudomonas sp. Fl4BN1]NBF08081.1 GtrA family protein [Pseudomonas sp. Fl4BN1]
MLRFLESIQRQHSIQLPRYLIVGGLATASHYCMFLLLINFVAPLPASLAGAVAGTLISYQGNKRWTFAQGAQAPWHGQMLRFCLTAFAYNLGNALMMLLLLDRWPQSPLLVQMFSTASLTLVSYWINRTWTFKHETF